MITWIFFIFYYFLSLFLSGSISRFFFSFLFAFEFMASTSNECTVARVITFDHVHVDVDLVSCFWRDSSILLLLLYTKVNMYMHYYFVK